VVTLDPQVPAAGGEQARVMAVHGLFLCGQTGPLETPAETVAQYTVSDLATVVTFEALPQGPKYSVVALVKGADGTPVAYGCVDGLAIYPEGTTEATLSLPRIALTLTASYLDSVSVDLNPWLDPQLDQVPAKLEAHFGDATMPATFRGQLTEMVRKAVQAQGYPDLKEECKPLLEANLDSLIPAHFQSLPDPWSQFEAYPAMMHAMLATATLRATVKVEEHVFAAPEHYRLSFTPLEVVLSDGAGTARSISAAAAVQATWGIEWQAAEPQATVTEHNHLNIDSVVVDVDPNRLALLVLTEVLGAEALGTADLFKALRDHFRCDQLAAGVTVEVQTCTKIPQADYAAMCGQIVTELNQPLVDWLTPLGTQRSLTLGQAPIAADADADLVMDTASGESTWAIEGGAAQLVGTAVWSRP
jgi:hypothetical protein